MISLDWFAFGYTASVVRVLYRHHSRSRTPYTQSKIALASASNQLALHFQSRLQADLRAHFTNFSTLQLWNFPPNNRNRLKEVAKELLAKLKAEKLRIDQWREKETTQSEVKRSIHDFLYDDKTGLPVDVYNEDDIKRKSETVFNYVFQQY
ncbi:MAG: hypothetical protein ACRD82_06790, partial [Blastocatellia bacterium]